MGLMDFKALVSVSVNGKDINSTLLPRLSSVTIVDTAGTQSDTLQLELTDHVGMIPIALPKTGAEIEVALGYALGAKVVGLYIADEVQVSGPPGRVTITAYSATHGDSDEGRSPISEQRSRSWPDGTTVKTLVETIARGAGYQAAVSRAAGEISLQHLDQIDESDIAILNRVARENGLIFKPAGGRLVMVKAGESASASGEKLPRVAVTPADITSWTARFLRREAVRAVVATYQDTASAASVSVRAEGAPRQTSTATSITDAQEAADSLLSTATQTRTIRRTQPTRAAAERAAQAELDRSRRAERQLSVSMPGRADLIAEGRLVLSGFRPGINGEWLITTVRHQLDGAGYRCSVECEGVPQG